MCNAIALGVASLAIGTATSVMGHISQQGQAKAQKAALDAQKNETISAAEQQKLERRKQSMREIAALRVSQAESGLGGLTAMRNIQNAFSQGEQDISIIESNKDRQVGQIAREKATVMGPSGIATGLQIAGSAMDGYNTYSHYSSPGGKTTYKHHRPDGLH